VQVVGELWTKFLATEYSAEISRLLAVQPDVIHTVNWGAGLASFINQGETRGVFEQSLVIMTTGLLNQAEILPKGAAFSGRGYHLQYPDPDKNAGNREYLRSYKAKFNSMPDYQGTFMAQAFYGLKAAIEKAVKVKNGAWPTTEEIAAAMEGLEFDTPRGRVLVRKDHEAVHEAMWGLTSRQKHPAFGYPILDQFRVFPASDVTPPEGKKTVEWIESWPTRK
jgi:branched-chain amino acid transport system substrate-binding protein